MCDLFEKPAWGGSVSNQRSDVPPLFSDVVEFERVDVSLATIEAGVSLQVLGY
jgi:hypothetical protein